MSELARESSTSRVPFAPPAPAVAPVRQLAVAISVGLGLGVVGLLIGVIADWATAAQERAAATAGSASADIYADRLDAMASQVTWLLVLLAAAVVLSVVFIVWMARARGNAELISARPHRLSRGMATGGWFIPIANLWISRIALEDVWAASAPSDDERQPKLVRAWWGIMLGALVVYIVGRIANPLPVVTISGGSVVGGLGALAASSQYVAVMNTVLLIIALGEAALLSTIVLRISAWQTTAAVRPDAPAHPNHPSYSGYPQAAVAPGAPVGPPPMPGAPIPVSLPSIRSTGTTAVIFAWIWTVLFTCAAIALATAAAELTARRITPTYEIGIVVFLGAFLLGLVMLIPAGAVFASWLQRAQSNASALSGTAPPVTSAWAVLGCLVPIANFIVPAQVMAFVARVSGLGGGLVGAWWTAWLAAWVTFWLGFPMPGRSINKAVLPLWPSAVLFVIAAVLLTVLVGTVGRHQELRRGGA